MKFLGKFMVRLNDGTTWPRPGGDESWEARFATPSPIVLAEIADAYDELIMLPERRRNEVIRALRIARHCRDENGDIVINVQPTPRGGGSDRDE